MSREGLTADDLMNAPRMSVNDTVLHRSPVAQQEGLTGLPLVDRGMACGHSEKSGCFLDEIERPALLTLFTGRINHAAAQFGQALVATRAERLMEKDQDPAWFVTLVMDVVGGYLISKFALGLLKLRDGLSGELASPSTANGEGSRKWKTQAATAISKVGKKDFESLLKPAFDSSKKAARSHWRGQDLSRREFVVQYLDLLADSSALGFAQIRELGPVGATDAQLVALTHGFDPHEHLFTQYKAALDEKLARLEKSGVMTIGSSQALHERPVNGGVVRTPVERHRRVAWIQYTSGRKTQLAYEQRDGAAAAFGSTANNGFANWAWPFDPEVTGYVPLEFVDVAVSRHLAVWRLPPMTIVVDDKWWSATSSRPEPSKNEPASSPSLPLDQAVPPLASDPTGLPSAQPTKSPPLEPSGAPAAPTNEPDAGVPIDETAGSLSWTPPQPIMSDAVVAPSPIE